MPSSKLEVSSGGLVRRGAPPEILMVQVQNLQGKTVWTFPKGHLEAGETPEQAALREVYEETGWECRIAPGSKRPFKKVQYFFRRGKELVRKQVIWFLMEPVKKTGSRDPHEILQTRWASFSEAEKLVSYKSDKLLLEELKAQATIE